MASLPASAQVGGLISHQSAASLPRPCWGRSSCCCANLLYFLCPISCSVGASAVHCHLWVCSILSWTKHPAPCLEWGLAQTTTEVFLVSAPVQSKGEVKSWWQPAARGTTWHSPGPTVWLHSAVAASSAGPEMRWDSHLGGNRQGRESCIFLPGPQQAGEFWGKLQGGDASLGCLLGFSGVLAWSRRAWQGWALIDS